MERSIFYVSFSFSFWRQILQQRHAVIKKKSNFLQVGKDRLKIVFFFVCFEIIEQTPLWITSRKPAEAIKILIEMVIDTFTEINFSSSITSNVNTECPRGFLYPTMRQTRSTEDSIIQAHVVFNHGV